MSLNKKELQGIIKEKRKEIRKLNEKIDTLKEEITQIEEYNRLILHGPLEDNHKFMKIIQRITKIISKKEVESDSNIRLI